MNLVERDHAPGGFQLVNPQESGKMNQFDLVEMASQIQQVSFMQIDQCGNYGNLFSHIFNKNFVK